MLSPILAGFDPLAPHSEEKKEGKWLLSYFRSGWTFLIPYLAVYLLYAWLNWPVNPAAAGIKLVKDTSESAGILNSPSLLHVYWFLHLLHLILASIAFRAWWRNLPRAGFSPHLSVATTPSYLERLWPLVPWLLLALIFWIPGIYLEWPSDPWEHLRRINEWRGVDVVSAHSSWMKSSYFIPYSLFSWAVGLQQIYWLDYYYTAICLLLSWQYYRLARAVNLSERASFVFVLFNTLLFGNNIFSFYRYYGLSSSIFAQIGAVALTRIALEAFWTPRVGRQPLSPSVTYYSVLRTAGAGLTLLLLIGFNHIQAVGIAGIGISAVVVWRLITWRRMMVFWLMGAVVTLSIATILWLPRNPELDGVYRVQGWFTAWHGFNLLSPASPAFERSVQILGLFGILNLIAGIILTARNHPAGWLTLSAPLTLILPFTAIPFANLLIQQDTILTFHRMLLAIPNGLAIACLLSDTRQFPLRLWMPVTTIAIYAFATVQPAHPANNRLWSSFASPPTDLTYRATIAAYHPSELPLRHAALLATEATAFVLEATYQAPVKSAGRTIGATQTRSITQVLGAPAVMHPPEIREMLAPGPSDWTLVSGALTEFIPAKGKPPKYPAIVQNGMGQATEIVTKDNFPIDPRRSYQVEMSVRIHSAGAGTAHLAVVWYDKNGRLLDAATPPPQGAGDPSGWRNGTYSYFGLVGETPQPEWNTYRISFGSGESRAIPTNAACARIGVLLNSNGSRDAVVQLSRARLWEKSEKNPVSDGRYAEGDSPSVFLSSRMNTYSPASQAGFLSNHWPSRQVAIENGGEPEFLAALDGSYVERKNGGHLIRILPQGSVPLIMDSASDSK